ncbi:MAG: ATP-binding protein [Geminicoccaceae bacterium]
MGEILTEACRLVGEALGTDLAKVMELQQDGQTLLVRAGVGWKPGIVGELTLKVTDNTSEGLALKTKEPMISPDIATETRFKYPQFLIDNGVKAVANVIIIGGRDKPPFGILQIDSREPRQFTNGHTAFLRSYANLLAAAVDRISAIGLVRDGEARLRLAMEAGELGSWELDLASGIMTCTRRYEQIFGYAAPPPAWTYDIFLEHVLPEDREHVARAFSKSVSMGTDWYFECRIHSADDGNVRWIEARGRPGGARDDTPPTHLIGILADISKRVSTEERVRQSQRLEAVGRLTAGVAHDFNNLLQALQGGLELAIDEVADQPAVRRDLEIALQACERGALLTSQLLSFSRQQVLRPIPLQLSSLLADLSSTLERTLGRDVRVHIDVSPNLPNILADASHLDSALLNLALNARDAMPRGGEMRIKASLRSGQVVIAVTDTGEGMTADVLAQACEPFFSTKGVEGSGLGLSMVHGFARQSGGELRIQSTPAQGTCIEIWLPIVSRAPVLVPAPALQEVHGQGKVLVVEDDPDVGRVVAGLLRKSGFQVTMVTDSNEALSKLGANLRFDVLVTDYAMRGMNGADLVLQARELRPALPALIITGYPGAEGLDLLPPDVAVLRKPFDRKDLVRKVKALIDGMPERVSLHSS